MKVSDATCITYMTFITSITFPSQRLFRRDDGRPWT
jgi:hypothetical protein